GRGGLGEEGVGEGWGGGEALGCREKPARLYEGVSAPDLWEPEGTIAEGFHLPRKPGGLPRSHRVRADPDTDPADRICAGWTARVRSPRVRHRCSFPASLLIVLSFVFGVRDRNLAEVVRLDAQRPVRLGVVVLVRDMSRQLHDLSLREQPRPAREEVVGHVDRCGADAVSKFQRDPLTLGQFAGFLDAECGLDRLLREAGLAVGGGTVMLA